MENLSGSRLVGSLLTRGASLLMAGAILLPGIALADHKDKDNDRGLGLGFKSHVSANVKAGTGSSSVNLPCMQTAVDKREAAIGAAFDAYAKSLSSALSKRRASLKAAWIIEDKSKRNKAIEDAWKTYRADRKAAVKTLHDAKKAAWKQFKTDAKACGGNSGLHLGLEMKGEVEDND